MLICRKDSADFVFKIEQAVVLKHNKVNKHHPRVAHRGIAQFLGIDQKCNQVIP